MTTDRIIVTVPTGASTEYQFRQTATGGVEVWSGSRRDNEFGLGHHYCDFDGKGKTAILRLMEDNKKYKEFFEAARKVSITDYHGGRLTGFIERDDADEDDTEAAYELISNMIEEADREEARISEDREYRGQT